MASSSFLPCTVEELVSLLHLIPHPEGGFFRETYRSGVPPMRSQGMTDFDVDVMTKKMTISAEVEEEEAAAAAAETESNSNLSEKEASTTSSTTTTTNTTTAATATATAIHIDALVDVPSRYDQRPDHDIRRNAMTSIYWVPTKKSPILPLICNRSDHVHYYQGGLPFEYIMYNPISKELISAIVGPDLRQGHQLQVIVPGNVWKCGRLLLEPMMDKNDATTAPTTTITTATTTTTTTTTTEWQVLYPYDYSLIGEAVAPGFDYYDFMWIDEALHFHTTLISVENQMILRPWLHENLMQSFPKQSDTSSSTTIHDFTQFYDTTSAMFHHRKQERM
jgi:predicted cupin superfamily sugar epimerase